MFLVTRLGARLPSMTLSVRSFSSVSSLRSEKRFTETHEWVSVSDKVATIGITDYAQKSLGDVTYVDLPEIGAELKAKEEFGAIESVKAASDLLAPVSGKVVEVNGAVLKDQGLVNKKAETDAWLIKIQVSGNINAELGQLLTPAKYEEFCSSAH